jgi:hypothetical protein
MVVMVFLEEKVDLQQDIQDVLLDQQEKIVDHNQMIIDLKERIIENDFINHQELVIHIGPHEDDSMVNDEVEHLVHQDQDNEIIY